jgi:hypothetical protein
MPLLSHHLSNSYRTPAATYHASITVASPKPRRTARGGVSIIVTSFWFQIARMIRGDPVMSEPGDLRRARCRASAAPSSAGDTVSSPQRRNFNTGGLRVYDISSNEITNSFFLGAIGLDWRFAGIAPIHAPGASDLLLRNVKHRRIRGLRHCGQHPCRTHQPRPSRLGLADRRLLLPIRRPVAKSPEGSRRAQPQGPEIASGGFPKSAQAILGNAQPGKSLRTPFSGPAMFGSRLRTALSSGDAALDFPLPRPREGRLPASAGPSTSSPGGPCVGTSSSRTGSTCGGDGSALIVTGLGPPGRDGAATICTTRPGTCCTPPRACSSSCRNTVCRSRALAGSDCCHECRRVHENLPLVRRFGVPAYSCG